MKLLIKSLFIFLLLLSCNKEKKPITIEKVDWVKHEIKLPLSNSLETGKTYLSIYPQIYSFSKNKTHDLTTLVSLRNVSETDTIFMSRADYFNTHGDKIESYISKSIYLKPLETIEIVIEENDSKGGTGSNFIFEWHKERTSNDPLFEAIMSSTMAQQGLSFTTQGVRIK